ncbi:hypothetical protein, partial [Rhodococcus rhodochrous]|uniref:hypothetical protein n=1 Tax=Rhodococcus rhodochrous TaxID=1829 RepID=UPI003FD3FD68
SPTQEIQREAPPAPPLESLAGPFPVCLPDDRGRSNGNQVPMSDSSYIRTKLRVTLVTFVSAALFTA